MTDDKSRNAEAAAKSDKPYGPLGLFIFVFAPFATGYFLSFLYRSINALIAPDLVADLGATSSTLGLLTAAFFLGFAGLQLPLGVMLDRYGAARVQSVLLLVAATGALLFAFAPNTAALIAARALIGVGCAGGLMAAFKAIMRWFPPNRLALVNGCYMAVGGVGAMAATKPAEMVLQITDWRGLFVGLAVLTLISATLIFFLAPRGDGAENPPELKVQAREVSKIFGDRLFWRVAPLSVFGMGGAMSVQTLWAGPWLTDSVALARDEVATRLLVMNAAMTVGFIATGWISDSLRARGISTLHVMAGGTLVSMLALLAITVQIDPAGWLHWTLFGFTCNVTAIVYAMLARHFGGAFAGRGNTANTLLVFAGTFLIQSTMGVIIDLWPRDATGAYPTAAYQAAFGLVLLGLLLSVFWMYRPGADKDEALAKAL